MIVTDEMVLAGAKALFKRDVEKDVCDGTWEENKSLHERILTDARACITTALAARR